MPIKKGMRVIDDTNRTYIVVDVIENRVAHVIPDDDAMRSLAIQVERLVVSVRYPHK